MKPIYTRNRIVGLLGGSFNPAHAGHIHISEYALRKLGIDEVWWLVSPQNPLKPVDGMGDYMERYEFAKNITRKNRHIYVSNIEKLINTQYTYQSLSELKKRYPGTDFIWLMGADNLAGFHLWQHWQSILKMMPVVVFDRSPYSFTSISSKTYQRMRRFLLNNKNLAFNRKIPSLRFIHMQRDPNSSTDIRKKLGKKAFLVHNK